MPDDFKLRYSEKYENTVRQDIQTDGRRAAKRRREFTALTTIAIDNMFRSGKVLYGDEVSVYCGRILDKLLADQPALRKELRVYTVRSNEPNAFSTHQGVILVTIGLVARLENEAQLAFVLAHEVAHYVKKHNLEAYEYNKELFREDMRNRRVALDERLLKSAKYSREAEHQADEYGWELYTKAGYLPEEVIKTHDLMLYAFLPVHDVEFPYLAVQDSFFKLQPDAVPYVFREVEAAEDVDDSKSTHPNAHKRKQKVHDWMSTEGFVPGGTLYQLDSLDFKQVLLLAQRDVLYNHLIENQYIEALMLCNSIGDTSEYISHAKAMAYYGIQKFANIGFIGKLGVRGEYQGLQGSYFHVFNMMNRAEINVMACREIWKLYQADTANLQVKELFEESIRELVASGELEKDFFDETVTDTLALEKRDETCYTCFYAFRDDAFTGLRQEFAEVLETYEQVSMPGKGTRTALKDAEKNRKELYLERMIILTPRYFGMDFRRSVNKRFLNADKKQLYLEQTTERLAEAQGMQVIIPDSRDQRDSMTVDFNNYTSMIDRIEESMVYEDWPYRSFVEPEMERICRDYKADYLALPMCWNLIERRRFSPGFALFATVVPYALPIYLYWQFTPQSYVLYAFMVMDLKAGKTEYVEVREMKTRMRNHVIKAHIYNSINQVAK